MGFLDPSSWANALSDDPTGAKAAADTQAGWQNRAIDIQQANLERQEQRQLPWLQAGTGAADILANRLGIGTAHPAQGYTELSGTELRRAQDEWIKSKGLPSQDVFDYRTRPDLVAGMPTTYYKSPTGEITTSIPTVTTAGVPSDDPRNLLATPQFKFDPSSVDVTQDPGYAFRLKSGVDAITAAGSAAGNLGSGNLLTALTRYGQDLGSQEYGAAYTRDYGRALDEYNSALQNQNTLYNRLAGLSGTGQVSAGNLAGQGLATASNIGGMMGQIGAGFGNAAVANRFLQNQSAGQISQQAGQGLGNWLMADSGYQWEDEAGSGNYVDTNNAGNLWNEFSNWWNS